MKFNKSSVLTFAEKCKSILAANWQCNLNTIITDANGSKSEIHSSTVKYILRKGNPNPYIWVPNKDLHNVNTVTDERGSISVANPFPGQLAMLLRSIEKPPARVALTGNLQRYEDEQAVAETLEEIIQSERKVVHGSSYAVFGVLSSSDLFDTSRSENLKELLNGDKKYTIYEFNPSSCTFIDYGESTHEVDLGVMRASKADQLASFSAQIIDGINQSEARRRALVLFCLVYLDAHVKDAYMLSVDRKGFNVLGKVSLEGYDEEGEECVGYEWKEYRLSLPKEALDIESFCGQLVEMEEEALGKVSEISGLG